jgi:8-oxo-dGTP pyrophosphatase MutT (NUDIX family)
MIYEKSCGVIVYKEFWGERLYLIIRSLRGEYGFPKGHVEGGETEYETAKRELKEETGVEAEIIDGFRRQIEYKLPGKTDVIKRSVYFIGKCTAFQITPQASEVSEAVFVPLSTALELLTFESTREILKEADTYLSATRSS